MTNSADTLTLQPTTTNQLCAQARFPKNFSGFQGHFLDNPILPGFLHIQLALDLLREANLPHILKEIQTAKFTHPIRPDTEIQITLTPTEPNAYEAKLTLNDEPLSTFTLTAE